MSLVLLHGPAVHKIQTLPLLHHCAQLLQNGFAVDEKVKAPLDGVVVPTKLETAHVNAVLQDDNAHLSSGQGWVEP